MIADQLMLQPDSMRENPYIYLFQFRLDVKYRFDKNHVIPNAFSRFFFDNDQINNINSNDKLNLNIYLDNLLNSFCFEQIKKNIHVLHETLIIMSNEFRKRIIDDYVKKNLTKIDNYVSKFKSTNSIKKESKNNC